jgi:hypothetical protein
MLMIVAVTGMFTHDQFAKRERRDTCHLHSIRSKFVPPPHLHCLTTAIRAMDLANMLLMCNKKRASHSQSLPVTVCVTVVGMHVGRYLFGGLISDDDETDEVRQKTPGSSTWLQ